MKIPAAILALLPMLCGPAAAAEARPSPSADSFGWVQFLEDAKAERDKLQAMMEDIRGNQRLIDAALKDIEAQAKAAAPQMAKLRKAGKTAEAEDIYKKIDADYVAKVGPLRDRDAKLFEAFAAFYKEAATVSEANIRAFMKEQDRFDAAFAKRLGKIVALIQ